MFNIYKKMEKKIFWKIYIKKNKKTPLLKKLRIFKKKFKISILNALFKPMFPVLDFFFYYFTLFSRLVTTHKNPEGTCVDAALKP